MTEKADVVIVGAGQAGAHVAMFLRQQKFAGSILLIGEEPVLPYERPAMSKEYLAGEKEFDKLVLRPATFWEEKKIQVKTGTRVSSVDHAARFVRTTADGSTIEFGKLVWATGGRPRRITCTGSELKGVHYVRDRADVDRMLVELAALKADDRIVIIGGGYIGLEVAACARKVHNKSVTVVEAQERVLARVAGVELATFFQNEHRAKGVDIRLGATVIGLEGSTTVTGVRLATDEVLPAALVVVGIGIDPIVEPLVKAGAEAHSGGVLIDAHGKTSLADVYAVGDCAAHPNIHAADGGKVIRLESIQNANDQAMAAAKSIAGTATEKGYEAVPWFWSNQYDLRLQTVGLFNDYDDTVVRGDVGARSFSVVYLRKKKVIALDCVNQTKDYMQGKPLIASGKEVDREKLARADVPLKEM